MERWTRWMLRYRWVVLAVWLVILVGGGWSSSRLSALLSNTFTMPGTDSERARTILKEHYGDRNDGAFTIVVGGTIPETSRLWINSARFLPSSARCPVKIS